MFFYSQLENSGLLLLNDILCVLQRVYKTRKFLVCPDTFGLKLPVSFLVSFRYPFWRILDFLVFSGTRKPTFGCSLPESVQCSTVFLGNEKMITKLCTVLRRDYFCTKIADLVYLLPCYINLTTILHTFSQILTKPNSASSNIT